MFVATVVFIGPSEGGRATPPLSGYHPQIKAGDEYTSYVIESLHDEVVFNFDEEHPVSLRLMFPEGHEDLFSVGSRVTFFEGHRLIRRRIVPLENGSLLRGRSRWRSGIAYGS